MLVNPILLQLKRANQNKMPSSKRNLKRLIKISAPAKLKRKIKVHNRIRKTKRIHETNLKSEILFILLPYLTILFLNIFYYHA